jgi:hypothetical protein
MPRTIVLIVALSLFAAGCNDSGKPAGSADAAGAKIQANLDKLTPEDRALAEEQKFCAHMTEEPLGKMGVPIKLMVKGEPVFVCCQGCDKKVLDDPDAALATVKRLKEQNAKKG